MAVQMGYAVVEYPVETHGDAPARMLEQIERLIGAATLAVWCEDETRRDGLQLDEGLTLADVPAVLTTWPQGRLFCEAMDLRWEHQPDGKLYLVVISDQSLDADGAIWRDVVPLAALPAPWSADDPADAVADESSTTCHLLLWGMYQDGMWQEGRIPGLTRSVGDMPCYPDHWPGPYAAIVARQYETVCQDDSEDADGLEIVRRVTRYLRYDGAYDPPPDPHMLLQGGA